MSRSSRKENTKQVDLGKKQNSVLYHLFTSTFWNLSETYTIKHARPPSRKLHIPYIVREHTDKSLNRLWQLVLLRLLPPFFVANVFVMVDDFLWALRVDYLSKVRNFLILGPVVSTVLVYHLNFKCVLKRILFKTQAFTHSHTNCISAANFDWSNKMRQKNNGI